MDDIEARHGLGGYLRKERIELKEKFEEMVFKEQIFWAQKAKIRWAKEGDINSKLFHMVAKGKKKRSSLID